ncbi:hypothetical protein PR048_011222 [Dryococelus australis]|uniref:Uncharacterized protein n=1 Tax=Dryococelus australis TaxID=614101 RepID=A0ABQ9HL02_9NEOP|nr:hypothetical protein PR048_011222 [Dryococelus australis]
MVNVRHRLNGTDEETLPGCVRLLLLVPRSDQSRHNFHDKRTFLPDMRYPKQLGRMEEPSSLPMTSSSFQKIMVSIQKHPVHVFHSPMGKLKRQWTFQNASSPNLKMQILVSWHIEAHHSNMDSLRQNCYLGGNCGIHCQHAQLAPSWNEGALAQFRSWDEAVKYRNERNHDGRKGIRDLPPLQVGNKVWIPDIRHYGQLRNIATAPRSYIVSTEKGQIHRNRQQLIEFTAGNRKETNPGQVRREKLLTLPSPVQDSICSDSQAEDRHLRSPEPAGDSPFWGFSESVQGPAEDPPFLGFPAEDTSNTGTNRT